MHIDINHITFGVLPLQLMHDLFVIVKFLISCATQSVGLCHLLINTEYQVLNLKKLIRECMLTSY